MPRSVIIRVRVSKQEHENIKNSARVRVSNSISISQVLRARSSRKGDGEVASGEFLSFEKAKELVEKDEKIHPQLSVCYKWFVENQNKVLND